MTAKNRYETLQSMPMGRVLLKLKPTCATFSIYRFFHVSDVGIDEKRA